jgi:hypothetical protein
VPAPQSTSCAFAGAGLNRLFVTTATEGWTEERWQTQPDAGLVYRFDIDASGRPPRFATIRAGGRHSFPDTEMSGFPGFASPGSKLRPLSPSRSLRATSRAARSRNGPADLPHSLHEELERPEHPWFSRVAGTRGRTITALRGRDA